MPACRTHVAAALIALFSLSASAAPTATPTTTPTATPSAQQRYAMERSACAAKTGDERSTCLKEANAALAAARNHELDGQKPVPGNALKRCQRLPDADRKECEARMRSGSVSGSVEGGGVLRQLVTTVPAASAASR